MNNNKTGILSKILAIICGISVLAADRIAKNIISARFAVGESKPFINGFIEFLHIKNMGGAWGFLSGKTVVLVPMTAFIMLLCAFVLVKYGKESNLLFWALTLVIFGGAGNMIDRIFYGGAVTDFLHFQFFPSFPVFNIADCAVVIGAGLLIVAFLLDSVRKPKKDSGNGDEQN